MSKRIFIDIETLPPAEEEREVYHERYVEYLAKRADKENALTFDQYFRDLAFDAATGRLLCIGIIFEEDGNIIHRGTLGRERSTGEFHMDEVRTLNAFWKLLKEFDPKNDLIIGHNAIEFDLLFLYRRSAVKDVTPTIQLPLRRFYDRPVYDTMWEWSRWQRKISLGLLADALRIDNPKSEEMNGGLVYDAFLAGRHDDLARYCIGDVDCLREIYNRMTFQKRHNRTTNFMANSVVVNGLNSREL